jgi:hypothetical protein
MPTTADDKLARLEAIFNFMREARAWLAAAEGEMTRGRIAALDATINTNNATAWNPSAALGMSSTVSALAVSGTTVYAGGNFLAIGGQSRSNIAALDATLNVNMATAWDPGADADVFALLVDGTTVYAGGFFFNIGGQIRPGIAALDATVNTNNATTWYPNATSGANSFSKSGSTIYAGGYFARIGEKPQSYLAAMGANVAGVPDHWRAGDTALLRPNRPNPFGATTLLRFSLTRSEVVDLAVYDLAGREVASPLRGRPLGPGLHEVELDGRGLASGVYLSRLRAGDRVDVRRIVHFH